ncbi:hypothetical protein PC9H_007573 [Pleurotus ostreatus]|uniref:Uncharacterized protein n=1 Tax=Pleurotus ostreatus TaxID=5322 RepID=A0A8H6ZU62_PLEOS|nr:uncharacterized protein PC9H_007573 [Pleurotus ostreatus]KAF7428351.1 hypothetical protein PC9H_007573 [Pleurotus ostreatus]
MFWEFRCGTASVHSFPPRPLVECSAYLTNPSETSFRAYLTEQSFRLHLSHLDDHLDDKTDVQTQPVHSVRPGPPGSAAYRPSGGDHLAASFHFAKRASVSLRTPKHVFHNFGICTIAAMMPIGKTPGRICNTTSYHLRDRDASSLIADSWYIGAFGRWWRGGVIEAWYRDLIARSSDEESWSSGILGIKSLDKFNNDCNGLPFTAKTRESTPKVRGRDRLQSSHQSRSQSPPPLPQSVSLPLHTTHQDLAPLAIPSTSESPIVGSHSRPVSDTAPPDVNSAVPLSRASSVTLFDQSPLIAEVLRQISAAKTSIQDARTQLTEQQASAAQSHASLQSEVTILRDRKRDEEATRLDLKSRTRALEETKRVSESSRRDAERRLKAARSARDDVTRRLESLSKEIQALQTRCDEDISDIEARKEIKGITAMEMEISEVIDEKRKEMKVAEDVVATLALRAKGLEEKLANERERLKTLRARVEHDRQTLALAASQPTSQDLWTISQQPGFVPSPITEYPAEIFDAGLPSPISDEAAYHFNSHIHYNPEHTSTHNHYDVSLGQGDLYPTLMDFKALSTSEHYPTTNLSPFNNDSDNGQDHALLSLFNRRPLVAPNYISTLDSTQQDASSFPSDLSFDGRWRRNVSSGIQELGNTQGIDMYRFRHPLGTSEMGVAEDASNRDILRGQSAIRRAVPHRTYSDPPHVHSADQSWEAVAAGGHDGGKGSFPRRWFSTSSKGPKKGLNPDAKVFSLPSFIKGSNPVLGASLGLQSYDNLNPNGLSMTSLSSTATSGTLFSGAFAPSPAEREVLQRALGGSSNASLERLPSLSDVGSIPSSPNHVHATAVNMNNAPGIGLGLHHSHNGMPQSHHMFPLPSWLQSLPRVRKPNFSPWDDEEPAPSASEAGRGDLMKSM